MVTYTVYHCLLEGYNTKPQGTWNILFAFEANDANAGQMFLLYSSYSDSRFFWSKAIQNANICGVFVA